MVGNHRPHRGSCRAHSPCDNRDAEPECELASPEGSLRRPPRLPNRHSAVPRPLPCAPLSPFIRQGLCNFPSSPNLATLGSGGSERVWGCWSWPEECPNRNPGTPANSACQAPPPGRGTEPCPGPQCTQRLSPGELSTAGKKSQRNEASPVARWRGHPLGPTAPAGAAAGVCGGWG